MPVVLGVDADATALATYALNVPGAQAMRADLATDAGVGAVAGACDFHDVNGVIGGPPCQTFSRSNKTSIGAVMPSTLALRMAKIGIAMLRRLERKNSGPRACFVVFENVPGFGSTDVYARVVSMLEAAGFRVWTGTATPP